MMATSEIDRVATGSDILVERIHPSATFRKAHGDEDLGFDLTACKVVLDEEREGLAMVHLGIRVVPCDSPNYGFMVAPRSSLSRTGWMMANSVGIIDPGYRGEWIIPLFKFAPWAIQPGDLVGRRVAQAISIFNDMTNEDVVYGTIDVAGTSRADGGFGSTGI